MKKAIIFISLLFILSISIVFLVRRPSYTIKTSGKLYIVNKLSRDVQVFDLFLGKEIADIPIGIESHEAIKIMVQDKVIVTNYGATDSKGNSFKIINTKTDKVEKIVTLNKTIKVNGILDYSHGNEVAVIDYVNNALVFVNSNTGGIEKSIPTNQKHSHLAVQHPTRPFAYVTNMDSNSVSVIDLNTNKVVKIIPCGRVTESIAITPDGSEVWVTNKMGNSVTVINTYSNEIVTTIPTGREPLNVKFSIDGRYGLVANANSGTISVYSQQTKKEVKIIRIPGKKEILEKILYHTPYPVNILMHPNGLYAFVSNSNASKIEVIDMKTLELVSTIGTNKIPDAMVFVE